MAQVGMLVLLLTPSVASAFLLNLTTINVYPKQGTVYGIFQASHPAGYAFNASVARDVCQHLGLHIADKAQVKYALERGFETCKFGWVNEQVAVIPRIKSLLNCGKGDVGMVVWRHSLVGKFDVFCFNVTDFDAQVQAAASRTTTANIQPTTSGAHTRPATHSASHGLPPGLRATPFGPAHSSKPNSLEEKGEAHALGGNGPASGAGLIASIATIFIILLIVIIAVWYFRTSGFCAALWNGIKPNVSIEKENRGNHMKDFESLETKADATVNIHPETEGDAA